MRKAACEAACENACKDDRGAEKEVRGANEAPSIWVLSRVMLVVWRGASEVLRG